MFTAITTVNGVRVKWSTACRTEEQAFEIAEMDIINTYKENAKLRNAYLQSLQVEEVE